MAAIWDPRAVLNVFPEGSHKCIGITLKNERCKNPSGSCLEAERLLDAIALLPPTSPAVADKLEGLAFSALCTRWHSKPGYSQVAEIVWKWQEKIKRRFPSVTETTMIPSSESFLWRAMVWPPPRATVPPPSTETSSALPCAQTPRLPRARPPPSSMSAESSISGNTTDPPLRETTIHSLSVTTPSTSRAPTTSTSRATTPSTSRSINSSASGETAPAASRPTTPPTSRPTTPPFSFGTTPPPFSFEAASLFRFSFAPLPLAFDGLSQQTVTLTPSSRTERSSASVRNVFGGTTLSSTPAPIIPGAAVASASTTPQSHFTPDTQSTALPTNQAPPESSSAPAPSQSRPSPQSPTPSPPLPAFTIPAIAAPAPSALPPPTQHSASPPPSREPTTPAPTIPPPTPCTHPHGAARRKPITEDCGICTEPICCPDDAVWCRAQCGQNVHRECFSTWKTHCAIAKRMEASSLERRLEVVTCVYCRTRWRWEWED